ncbi:MAG: PBSX family phage terminase large subunit [Eubacteriales bacterium]
MSKSFVAFSPKQKTAMLWWHPARTDTCHYDAIVCDGAVRSGKTLSMGMGFVLWAMSHFHNQRFGLCGKTIGSLRRNVVAEVMPKLQGMGMDIVEKRSENKVIITFGSRKNEFFCFGGKDESSADMIQGITFAGILLDEVVLMPRSFVEQACARCSVTGSKLWFNCNPASSGHWFYEQWIAGAKDRNCLHLHFTMEDNPSLAPAIRQRYERLYTGVFYKRFVLGEWVAAEGRVYDFYDPSVAPSVPEGEFSQWYISCDYGTVNPASFGLWGKMDGVWYRVSEFYFDSRREGRQMTDGEYAVALERLAQGRHISAVIVDPSAASFMEVLRRADFRVLRADNRVLEGIRMTSQALKEGQIVICDTCTDCLREMGQYVWDGKSGHDGVVKEFDHAMDDMRYFVTTALMERPKWTAKTVERRS